MKRILLSIKRDFLLYLSLFLIFLDLLAILAPVFTYLKIYFLSDMIYGFFQWFCHQRPWRSYHLFDYQLALDARMITLLLGSGIGGIVVWINRLKALKLKWIILILVLGFLPMAIDGTTQLIGELSVINKISDLPFYESTNLIRSLTGVFASSALSISLFPYLNEGRNIIFKDKYILSIVTTLLLNILIIPILVFLWFVSSTKYIPSDMFIDNIRRYPGYNYEIVTNGSHSSFKRVITESIIKFIERAKYFNKESYLLKCSEEFKMNCKDI